MKKRTTPAKAAPRKKQAYPRGWNEKRVRDVIAYYDRQTEDEELAEYEAAMKLEDMAMMLVPSRLVPEIHRFIDRRLRA